MVWAAHSDREPTPEWLRQQVEPILAQIEGVTP
ncbi:LysR family transcriptional regulator [Advenella sp. S44]|nr:LysR family transcriptional regulator [Advenella sp. S44]